METQLKGQVTKSAADVYEEFFVPALFGQWAPRIADLAGLGRGQAVLDVACGTGALARELATRVGPEGSVTGLDCNEEMLGVARREAPEIDWRSGQAEALPFRDGQFDAVLSQFGMMFFTDRAGALREMWRVLRAGHRMVVAVCGPLEASHGYADLVVLLERLFGARVAQELNAPFVLGSAEDLLGLAGEAGVEGAQVRRLEGTACFSSIDAWMHTDVRGWTLADMIDDEQYALLLREARRELASYVRQDGTVRFAFPANVLVADKASI